MKFRTFSNEKRQLNLNWDSINVYTGRYKPNTSFEIEIVKRQPRKSDPLRKYYFSAVCKPFMEHLGYEPHELDLFHRQLKITYFQIKPDQKGIYRGVPSIFSNESEIPVPEKRKFVEWVMRIASKEGCYISDPGEK